MTCENLHIGFCRSIPDLYRMIVEAKGDALTLLLISAEASKVC